MRRHSFTISQFVCPDCGLVVPLPRGKNRPRENGHIKDIWCARCGEIRKFKEIKNDEFIRTLEDVI